MRKLLLYNGFSNLMLEIVVWMIYLKSQGWTITQIALLEGFLRSVKLFLSFLQV